MFGHQPQNGSGDVTFYLDPLWSSSSNNFIGIDNYMPLSDRRDGDAGSAYNQAALQASIAGGDGRASPAWEAKNLITIKPPFRMTYAGHPISSVTIHRSCAESLSRVLADIWTRAEKNQATVEAWGASLFGGIYNFRLKRGSSSLSMHAFACAIDLAPERFPMGRTTPTFCDAVLEAFAAEGWVNLPKDRMHFQAATL